MDNITNDRIFVSNKGAGYFFPLYILKNQLKKRNLSRRKRAEKKSNINEYLTKTLQKTYCEEIKPEQILYYIYAVLFSETYRQRYEEFLKTNFPRIPFTKNVDNFLELSQLGEDLATLHLLKSTLVNESIIHFQGEGDNIVTKPFYDQKGKSLHE